MTDQRPTSHLGKFQMAISLRGVVDLLHVWFYGGVFEDGGSNGAMSGFATFKMAARPPSWKIQMAVSPCLVLGWGFHHRWIE